MSAGLLHGTGGPVSITPRVYDVPSVTSVIRSGNRGTSDDGATPPTAGPPPSPIPGAAPGAPGPRPVGGAPGTPGIPGMAAPAPPPSPGPPAPAGPSRTMGHGTPVMANRW